MDFDAYMKSMAEICHQVYEEMTRQTAIGINVEKMEPPFPAVNYKSAIVIPYGNKENKIEGRFILGFNEERMAVKLAADIAKYMGIPVTDGLDAMATDLLFEFMNTVAGKVITEWDGMGLAADFKPPQFKKDLTIHGEADCELMVHVVTLLLQNSEKLSILASLEETGKYPLKNKKVLVVDDSKSIRFMLNNTFRNQGCHVSEAENGLEGIVRTQAVQPDLIIMDLIMPKMGGLEAIAKIREINPFIPVIVLTSTSKKEEVIKAASLKIKGYIKKPIKMDQLLTLATSIFNSDDN